MPRCGGTASCGSDLQPLAVVQRRPTACLRALPQVVSVLLAGGADVGAVDFDGNQPLHCAAYYGDVPVVRVGGGAGAGGGSIALCL